MTSSNGRTAIHCTCGDRAEIRTRSDGRGKDGDYGSGVGGGGVDGGEAELWEWIFCKNKCEGSIWGFGFLPLERGQGA